jgi:GNAT superfamily N-acetyltransferase
MNIKLKLDSEFSLSNDGIYCLENSDLMVHGIYTKILLDESDQLSEEELENGEEKLTEIGKIECHRFDLRYSESVLFSVADCHDSDLAKCASYFFYEEGKDLLEQELTDDAIFYINSVYIKPEYRGKNYGLYALALLLEGIAWGQVVSCHPVPIHDYKDKYSEKKGKLLLTKYWSKLGLEYYDEKHNILWGADWVMPEWIRKKLFPNLEDEDEDDELVEQENYLMRQELELQEKMQRLSIFWEYLRCIENYAYDRVC